jgi:hypothetical protein
MSPPSCFTAISLPDESSNIMDAATGKDCKGAKITTTFNESNQWIKPQSHGRHRERCRGSRFEKSKKLNCANVTTVHKLQKT